VQRKGNRKGNRKGEGEGESGRLRVRGRGRYIESERENQCKLNDMGNRMRCEIKKLMD
jgi:hypothetical protein